MSHFFPRMKRLDESEKKGGRKKASIAMPELEDNFVEVMGDQTAGDPMSNVIWTDRTQQEIAYELSDLATPVSTEVVRQLLDDFDFSKRKAQKSVTMGVYPYRNEQFEYLAELKDEYLQAGEPVISMDTKKKKMLGNFFRAGHLYANDVLRTLDHDFASHAGGKVIPHGLYDLRRNVGHVTLGLSHDTSEFACDSFAGWWRQYGRRAYPHASKILLLCDCGGSNNYRHHIFKEDLQRLVNRIGIPIRIAHYPPYCSKYNPIEHRLFPHITRACQGIVFHTLEIVKRFIRKTCTRTGLRVTLNVLAKEYQTKRKASWEFLEAYPILFDEYLSDLNYTAVPCAYM
jgi:hypothetical protein